MEAFLDWLQDLSWVHNGIGQSGWIYGTCSVLHYFCVFLCIGLMALLDLRVMGIAVRRQTIAQVADQVLPWMWVAFGIAMVSGFLEFAAVATTFAPDRFFRAKLALILAAAVFAVIIQRNARKWSQLPSVPTGAKVVAALSLLLWLGAILAALNIAAFDGLG